MASAYQTVSTKINESRTDYTRFETYSSDLDNLLDECKEVDDAVKSKVSRLTGDFKKANGIRDNVLENALAYTFSSIVFREIRRVIMKYMDKQWEWWNIFAKENRDLMIAFCKVVLKIDSFYHEVEDYINDVYRYFFGKDLGHFNPNDMYKRHIVLSERILEWIREKFF